MSGFLFLCVKIYFLELGVLLEELELPRDVLEEALLVLGEDDFDVFTEEEDSVAELRELEFDELLLLVSELRVLGVERLVSFCAGLALPLF